MVRSTQDILQALRDEGDALRRLGVERLALFGSGARGQLREGSDLDILVELRPKTFDTYMDVKEFLESRFSCCVDLVLVSALKPAIKAEILREAVDAPLS